jgi:hypothetical protein
MYGIHERESGYHLSKLLKSEDAAAALAADDFKVAFMPYRSSKRARISLARISCLSGIETVAMMPWNHGATCGVSPASLRDGVKPYSLTDHIHERESGYHLSKLLKFLAGLGAGAGVARDRKDGRGGGHVREERS